MTRAAMAKRIEESMGKSELDGVRHIDRPTSWLRKMFAEIERHDETVGCLKCELVKLSHSL